MKGFYSIDETARTLGVHPRHVHELIRDGSLRSVHGRSRRIWIPEEDVHLVYDRGLEFRCAPSMRDHARLRKQVDDLEEQLRILQTIGLGYDIPKEPLTDEELLQKRAEAFSALKEGRITHAQMKALADSLMTIRPQEVIRLYTLAGKRAWSPVFQLFLRAKSQLREHEDFPRRGLDLLYQRLERAQARLLGMLQLELEDAPDVDEAFQALAPGDFDYLIISLLNARNR